MYRAKQRKLKTKEKRRKSEKRVKKMYGRETETDRGRAFKRNTKRVRERVFIYRETEKGRETEIKKQREKERQRERKRCIAVKYCRLPLDIPEREIPREKKFSANPRKLVFLSVIKK